MGEEAGTIAMGTERTDDESEIDTDFEIDDEEIQHSLNSLLNIPLEFEDSSDEEQEEDHEEHNANTSEKIRGDSVERQLEAMFVGDKDDPGGGGNKDTGLENITDNEFDGPESGECDTSDGELPDSPNIVVTLPDTPPVLPSKIQGVDEVSLDEDSDIELLEEYQTRGRDYCNTVTQKISVPKTDREVIIDTRVEPDIHKSKEKDSSKLKEKNWEKSKSKEKKDKTKKKTDVGALTVDMKRKLKLKKYLARLDQYRSKCLEYMSQISTKCDIVKNSERSQIKIATEKIRSIKSDNAKLKSIVEKVHSANDRDVSPQSSTSSRLDQMSHSSFSSRFEKGSHTSLKSSSSEKERKSKSVKKPRSKSKELKEHKLQYQRYIQYLQSERKKCYEERLALGKHKNKPKRKHSRKSESKSPDKIRDKLELTETTISRPPVLSFLEFCSSRELSSPEKDLAPKNKEARVNNSLETRKERTISVDSIATTSTAQSERTDHVDDDRELFITYSDLVQQDILKETKHRDENKDSIETESEKDPEMENISIFTSVLFKGSTDSGEIPFLQESRPASPKSVEIRKPKAAITPSTEPDDLYDWKDDLSNISQSSLSPSRSPVPKIHNKALLNFLENEKEHIENKKIKKLMKKSAKSSRSRSKSPKKDISRLLKKKRSKHHSSKSISSVSPSPPPLKARSPEVYKKRPSPPAYLKERWRDYPSPTDRRREHYDRKTISRRRSRSRTRPRVGHRSRSSSEERHYRRYRSRSRSRSRSPPTLTMVQLTNAEKRRRLKEEHEKALASLRATIPKPLSSTPLEITFRADGDNYEGIRDNYDPVGMNEVNERRSVTRNPAPLTNGYSHQLDCWTYPPTHSTHLTPQYYYYPPKYYF